MEQTIRRIIDRLIAEEGSPVPGSEDIIGKISQSISSQLSPEKLAALKARGFELEDIVRRLAHSALLAVAVMASKRG